MVIIVAPHPDDEVIGNWEVLNKEKEITVFYGNTHPKRKEEALNLRNEFPNIKHQIFNLVNISSYNKSDIFYFPDPITEVHPDHRMTGGIGERILRDGYDVIFYSVNMNVPYTHLVENFEKKRDLLNRVYPSQQSLWEYEHKYFMYEGRVKWLM